MKQLRKWKESTQTPISIERQIKPLLGFHRTLSEAMNDVYNLFENEGLNLAQFENRTLYPAMDIVESDEELNIEIEMPGMGEEDIKITINEDRLTIQGEKSTSSKHKDKNYISREINYGRYERSIALPTSVDTSKATATFKKGMLWVKIPKKAESKNHSREVKIQKS